MLSTELHGMSLPQSLTMGWCNLTALLSHGCPCPRPLSWECRVLMMFWLLGLFIWNPLSWNHHLADSGWLIYKLSKIFLRFAHIVCVKLKWSLSRVELHIFHLNRLTLIKIAAVWNLSRALWDIAISVRIYFVKSGLGHFAKLNGLLFYTKLNLGSCSKNLLLKFFLEKYVIVIPRKLRLGLRSNQTLDRQTKHQATGQAVESNWKRVLALLGHNGQVHVHSRPMRVWCVHATPTVGKVIDRQPIADLQLLCRASLQTAINPLP